MAAANASADGGGQAGQAESYVVQEYLANPLLIGGMTLFAITFYDQNTLMQVRMVADKQGSR